MSPEVSIRPLAEPGDLGWVVMAHGEVYAREFGWDTSFEALVARIVADYASGHDEQREAAWIAEGGLEAWTRFLLKAVREILLADPAYLARLERHYTMVKQKIAGEDRPRPWWKKPKKPKRRRGWTE